MAQNLGIENLLEKKCGELSYGQRQRVAIIRALSQPFEYLLLDEPFSHLDDENTQKACTLIETALAKNNAGLILVSLGEKYFLKYDKEIKNPDNEKIESKEEKPEVESNKEKTEPRESSSVPKPLYGAMGLYIRFGLGFLSYTGIRSISKTAL